MTDLTDLELDTIALALTEWATTMDSRSRELRGVVSAKADRELHAEAGRARKIRDGVREEQTRRLAATKTKVIV